MLFRRLARGASLHFSRISLHFQNLQGETPKISDFIDTDVIVARGPPHASRFPIQTPCSKLFSSLFQQKNSLFRCVGNLAFKYLIPHLVLGIAIKIWRHNSRNSLYFPG
jgi:hypothetical protein